MTVTMMIARASARDSDGATTVYVGVGVRVGVRMTMVQMTVPDRFRFSSVFRQVYRFSQSVGFRFQVRLYGVGQFQVSQVLTGTTVVVYVSDGDDRWYVRQSFVFCFSFSLFVMSVQFQSGHVKQGGSAFR